ncbi:MAG: DinB family protein [Actinomycetota bacterium]
MTTSAPTPDPMRDDLHRYLNLARESLLWKLEGVSEYDLRRPMTPTGTNLLGLVKHVASVEAGYLGDVFGRPFPEQFPWFAEDAEPNADMWATPDQSADDIIGLYHRVWAHSDATVESLPLDAIGVVPWWPEDRQQVSLHRILVHITTETHRHAGHADIVRELIDGTAGLRAEATNLPDGDPASWHEYVQRVEQAARDASLNDASLNDASLNDEGPTGEPGGAFVTTYGWR